ncbi:MAG TPA: FliG C-terminal domain-containing protein [Kofleriaceae bacterium]|nr:FliG C-terminal domain-containing protein [Kofleriaceae bacterium]
MPGPELTGPQKAAIALLSLDEEIATQVLGRMAEEDVRRLVAAVEQLDDVGGEVISRVLEDLERELASPLAVVRTGGTKYVRKLADAAFGSDRAQRLFGVIAPPSDPLQLLRTARVNAIAQLLTEEHPQIAAVVLTQLPAAVAAKVLALMPQDIAADLTSRISELEEVPEHAVAEASESLVRALEIAGGLAASDARSMFDGLAFSAAIVNELSSEAGDDLLGKIAERDETIASRIREALFTFEDLQRIATRELGNLMRAVQSETLVTALQTATAELRDHLLSSLSQRAAATLRDDLASASPKRLSEVEAAQREVVEAAMKLAADGKLTMPNRGGE